MNIPKLAFLLAICMCASLTINHNAQAQTAATPALDDFQTKMKPFQGNVEVALRRAKSASAAITKSGYILEIDLDIIRKMMEKNSENKPNSIMVRQGLKDAQTTLAQCAEFSRTKADFADTLGAFYRAMGDYLTKSSAPEGSPAAKQLVKEAGDIDSWAKGQESNLPADGNKACGVALQTTQKLADLSKQ